jgi:hypothetical protein
MMALARSKRGGKEGRESPAVSNELTCIPGARLAAERVMWDRPKDSLDLELILLLPQQLHFSVEQPTMGTDEDEEVSTMASLRTAVSIRCKRSGSGTEERRMRKLGLSRSAVKTDEVAA